MLELSGCPCYADRIEQSFYNAYRGAFNTMRVPSAKDTQKEKFNTLLQIVPFDSYSPLVADTRGRRVGGFNILYNNGTKDFSIYDIAQENDCTFEIVAYSFDDYACCKRT